MWTDHRVAESGRFVKFVRESGLNLNSPCFSREKTSQFRGHMGLVNLVVLDALL